MTDFDEATTMTDRQNDFRKLRIASIGALSAQLDTAWVTYLDAVERHTTASAKWEKQPESIRLVSASLSLEQAALDANRANARMLSAARALVALLETG